VTISTETTTKEEQELNKSHLIKHTIQLDDTFKNICKRFGTSPESVRRVNPLLQSGLNRSNLAQVHPNPLLIPKVKAEN